MLIRNSCLSERWAYECDASVISIAATPNCSLISATTVGRSLYLFNSTGDVVWKKSGDEEGLDHEGWSTAVSSDGGVIAVGTANKKPADGSVYVFNAKGDQLYSETVGSPVWSLSFSSDGGILGASCWDGKAYKYVRHRSTYKRVAVFDSKNQQGLYGLKLAHDGAAAFVIAYDSALIQLNDRWKSDKRYAISDGGYNLAAVRDDKTVFVGLRKGEILRLKVGRAKTTKLKINGCERPICGIAGSRDGELIVAGSFDGWVYLVGPDGAVLARLETNGEVWSVACSEDAAKICVASGDETVRFLDNYCNSTSLIEVAAIESACARTEDSDSVLQRLVEVYTNSGLYEYGYNRLKYLQERRDSSESIAIEKRSAELLLNAIKYSRDNHWAHFELGVVAKNRNRHRDAISHFQIAANDPTYTVRAMMLCAESFRAKKLPTATASCYRRARGQQLDGDAKRILYNLGRSYEDSKHWQGAFSHYQLLASWDIGYRNVWERLENIIDVSGSTRSEVTPPRIDYTGLTTSFLGPDVPRDVDDSLKDVLRARSSEVLIEPGERAAISEIIKKLRSNERFCRGITGTGLDYDQELFLKYDYALPEDETKKFLETVNLLFLLKSFDPKDNSTLDIGSATGRYPMLFRWMGAHPFGLDIEPRAIEYAEKQRASGDEWPKYFNADASKPFPRDIPEVDLITCMMGTFAHISIAAQQSVIRHSYDRLRRDGYLAISTWDLECSHLSYLSIYNEVQKDTIRRNSPSASGIKEMLARGGFRDIQIRSSCLLPQIIVYDLGIENLRSGDIELAAQADLAVRSLYPKKHGEMFIAFARK
jgi:tetratricopeptide (TPR) repeat protein